MSTRIGVAVDIDGEIIDVGTTFLNADGDHVSGTFTYLPTYLADRRAYSIDPALPLTGGAYGLQSMPGAFQDSSPDRWGRRLISRELSAVSRRTATAIDFLLGISDELRQGALRFRIDDGFVAPAKRIPRLVELPHLLDLSRQVGRRGEEDDLEAVKELLDAGTATLGGARPKAIVRDEGRLWLAKFPHPDDQWDVGVWEAVTLQMARAAGIRVPDSRLVPVGTDSTLLVGRFDRDVTGHRHGYWSAMTLTQSRDGDAADYLDIVDAFEPVSMATTEDLQQLWRRIAFSVAVHNTDDHLRNHGFLRVGAGWRLSPAFDINPNPDTARGRQTAIAGIRQRDGEVDALLEIAEAFRTSPVEARAVLTEILAATNDWRTVATTAGARPGELDRFERAFEGLRDQLQHAADPVVS